MNKEKNPYLSIVVPAYNEEDRIGSLLENYNNSMNSFYPKNFEIIVVCNGCVDRTSSIVQKFSEKHPNIKCLAIKKKLGKGGAITEGFKKVKGELIGFTDADGAIDSYEYMKLIKTIDNSNVDVAIASKKIEGATALIKQPLKRRIASRVFNLLVQLMFGLDFKDTQCGAKIFKKDVINNISTNLKSTGFEFDVELLWRIEREGYIIKEVPITWSHQGGSTFSLKYAPEMFINLLKIRWFG